LLGQAGRGGEKSPRRNANNKQLTMHSAASGAFAPDEDMLIGIPVIDAQHSLLFRLANRLLDHPAASARDEPIVDILTELGKSLILHFQTEEAVMRQLGVPADEIEQHAESHVRIIDQYTDLNLAAVQGNHHTAAEIYAKVCDWIHTHFSEEDRLIRRYVPPDPS
jgi:hemerythrin-like metal-binding protein